jgi:hypothetical protein
MRALRNGRPTVLADAPEGIRMITAVMRRRGVFSGGIKRLAAPLGLAMVVAFFSLAGSVSAAQPAAVAAASVKAT